jgi:hypothetical protein
MAQGDNCRVGKGFELGLIAQPQIARPRDEPAVEAMPTLQRDLCLGEC